MTKEVEIAYHPSSMDDLLRLGKNEVDEVPVRNVDNGRGIYQQSGIT